MTPATATQMKRTNGNILDGSRFRSIRPIQASDIPVIQRGRRGSPMRDLEVVKEFNALLDLILEKNINPAQT